MEVQMRTGVLVGVGAALALVVVSATDASACSRRSRVCGAYAPAPVYQHAPPPAAYYAPPNVPVGYGYVPPAYVYGTGGYGYRNCDCDYGRGYGYGAVGYGYGRGYGYAAPAYGYGAVPGYGYGYRNCDRGYGYAPPVAYDNYRPAAVWAPFR
jgi:hypothetical protein